MENIAYKSGKIQKKISSFVMSAFESHSISRFLQLINMLVLSHGNMADVVDSPSQNLAATFGKPIEN